MLRSDQPAATAEQMLLHVDMAAGKVAPLPDHLYDRLKAIEAAHASLPRPRLRWPRHGPAAPQAHRLKRSDFLMDFGLTDEQRAIVDTVRQFVDRELVPYEDEVEELDEVTPELAASIRVQGTGGRALRRQHA